MPPKFLKHEITGICWLGIAGVAWDNWFCNYRFKAIGYATVE
jgi:hypothetical protein